MFKPFEIIKDLISIEWQTRQGCLFYSVGILFLSLIFIYSLQQISITLNSYWLLKIILVFQIIHIVAWLVKRNWFYNSNVLTIAFGISTEDSSKEYYKEIKKRFKEQILSQHLEDIIKVKELAGDIKFDSVKNAEEFISKKNIRLLIWGDTNEGNINNAPFTQFNIMLSYQYNKFLDLDEHKQKRFISDINNAVQRKHWGIWRPNSFINLGVVSGNIVEMSFFTLAACLASVPNINYLLKATDIFEKLYEMLKQRKQDENFPNLSFVKQKVHFLLRDAYNILLVFYWNERKDLSKSIKYAEKAIAIDENNFIAHQNMSVFRWLNGEHKLAKYHTKRAWNIIPGHSLPRFNKAFFYFYDKKFEQGFKQYKKIKDVGVTNIVNVVEFIEKESEKNTNNLGLLFIVGWLNIEYVDQSMGITQLQDFLQKSNNNNEYKYLIEEAKKTLSIHS